MSSALFLKRKFLTVLNVCFLNVHKRIMKKNGNLFFFPVDLTQFFLPSFIMCFLQRLSLLKPSLLKELLLIIVNLFQCRHWASQPLNYIITTLYQMSILLSLSSSSLYKAVTVVTFRLNLPHFCLL